MKITVTGIRTDEGMMIVMKTCCSNGTYWTAENCFKYINNSLCFKEHQADKLKSIGRIIDKNDKADDKWYLDRDNFVDLSEFNVKDIRFKGYKK